MLSFHLCVSLKLSWLVVPVPLVACWCVVRQVTGTAMREAGPQSMHQMCMQHHKDDDIKTLTECMAWHCSPPPASHHTQHMIKVPAQLDKVTNLMLLLRYRIIAGKDHAVGEEVTITYGPMRNDELLLYYGFLDEVTQPPRLAAIDHPK